MVTNVEVGLFPLIPPPLPSPLPPMLRSAFCSHLLFFLLALAPNSWGQTCDCQSSWTFRRSTYSHAPETGGRVAQFQRIEPVEGLDDPRQYTSGYRRTRTTLRGADGSVDASY